MLCKYFTHGTIASELSALSKHRISVALLWPLTVADYFVQLCGRKLAKAFVRHMASNDGLFITGGLGLIMASLMVYKATSIFTSNSSALGVRSPTK